MLWWLDPALVFARHYATKFKKPLLITAAAVALYGGGVGTGWVMNDLHHAKAEAAVAVKAVEQVVTEAAARDEVVRTQYVTDLTTTRKLEAERDRLRAQNASLQERIDSYVPETAGPDGSGYLSAGAVSLLNDAVSVSPAPAAGSSSPTSVEEALAPSSVSWRDLARYTVKISGTYNDAMLQCNALIDWVDVNVVNKTAQP